ncbi:MAG: STAS domain-containing protein [Candidatus Bathyarchaeota archaeon]|nr:STAS domain-containing protein [Candidatus Bathyarchaeota archaeon]
MRSKLTSSQFLKEEQRNLLETWKKNIRASAGRTFELMPAAQFDQETQSFLAEFVKAISSENYEDITQPEYKNLLTMLRGISSSRAEQGFTPSETALFIMGFKEAVNTHIGRRFEDPKRLATEVLVMGSLIDKLALYTFETFVESREKMMKEQAVALEFSNPMIMVWNNLIAFPLQGILDTHRMAKFTTEMLDAITRHQARVVIIDLTAIPAMDTATCHRLIQAIKAAQLMGSEAIITGISPPVASIIVKLGVDLEARTLRELREGIQYAFRVLKLNVVEEAS